MTGVQIRRSEGSLPTWHQLPEPVQGNCLCFFKSRVVVLGSHGCWGWIWDHSRWVSLAQGRRQGKTEAEFRAGAGPLAQSWALASPLHRSQTTKPHQSLSTGLPAKAQWHLLWAKRVTACQLTGGCSQFFTAILATPIVCRDCQGLSTMRYFERGREFICIPFIIA